MHVAGGVSPDPFGRVVVAVMGGILHRRLDRLYDGGHGADQLPESFGRPVSPVMSMPASVASA
jgi:hypothetical protein